MDIILDTGPYHISIVHLMLRSLLIGLVLAPSATVAAVVSPVESVVSTVPIDSGDPAGPYVLTVRECDGPLASVYPVGATIPLVITPTGQISFGGSRNLDGKMRSSLLLETGQEVIDAARGRFAGRSITTCLRIDIQNNTAAGGTVQYSIDDEGRTKSGSCTFSLARSP